MNLRLLTSVTFQVFRKILAVTIRINSRIPNDLVSFIPFSIKARYDFKSFTCIVIYVDRIIPSVSINNKQTYSTIFGKPLEKLSYFANTSLNLTERLVAVSGDFHFRESINIYMRNS